MSTLVRQTDLILAGVLLRTFSSRQLHSICSAPCTLCSRPSTVVSPPDSRANRKHLYQFVSRSLVVNILSGAGRAQQNSSSLLCRGLHSIPSSLLSPGSSLGWCGHYIHSEPTLSAKASICLGTHHTQARLQVARAVIRKSVDQECMCCV